MATESLPRVFYQHGSVRVPSHSAGRWQRLPRGRALPWTFLFQPLTTASTIGVRFKDAKGAWSSVQKSTFHVFEHSALSSGGGDEPGGPNEPGGPVVNEPGGRVVR